MASGAASDYFENVLLNHAFKVAEYTPPAHIYIALCKSTLDDTHTGTTLPGEVTGGGYERTACDDWAIYETGKIDNDGSVSFPQATADWGTITDIALCDAQTGGNILTYGKLYLYKPVVVGDVPTFEAGSIRVSLTDEVDTNYVLVRGVVAAGTTVSGRAIATAPTGLVYWVGPYGTAAWAAAKSETPLTGTACASIATGLTPTPWRATPSTFGAAHTRPTSARLITAPPPPRLPMSRTRGKRPTSSSTRRAGAGPSNSRAMSYIKIDGITSTNSGAFFRIGYGSCYNEITNCYVRRGQARPSTSRLALITWTIYGWGAGVGVRPQLDSRLYVHEIRIHLGLQRPRDDPHFGQRERPDQEQHHRGLTSFPTAATTCMDIGGRYNVARNNVFHNEEAYFADTSGTCDELPGERILRQPLCPVDLTRGDYVGTAYHTLLEGNRIGHAGTPPDDDGADGIENAGCHTIARYNYIYGCYGMGYYSKQQPAGGGDTSLPSGSWARVYNNTITRCGSATEGGAKYEADLSFTTAVTIWSYSTDDDWPQDIAIKNNIVYRNRAELGVRHGEHHPAGHIREQLWADREPRRRPAL
ncbi:MAG: hypothetical protein MZV70_03580 [Desulfobacterales bacterium]|nr:hypothetical protein [Desulfobacterales bacterium]